MQRNVVCTCGKGVIHPGVLVLWVMWGKGGGEEGGRAWGRDCVGGRNRYTGREETQERQE